MFADDVMLFKPISSSSYFLASQTDIDLVNHCMLKSKFMLITHSIVLSFHLNGLPIEIVHHLSTSLFCSLRIKTSGVHVLDILHSLLSDHYHSLVKSPSDPYY